MSNLEGKLFAIKRQKINISGKDLEKWEKTMVEIISSGAKTRVRILESHGDIFSVVESVVSRLEKS